MIDLGKEYGDAWLYSAGATKVQNVMGIQSSAPKSDGFFGIKSPTQTTEQLIDHLFPDEDEANKTAAQVGTEQQRTSTPINKNRAIAAVSEVSFTIKHSNSGKLIVILLIKFSDNIIRSE